MLKNVIMHLSTQEITMGTCKTKTMPVDFDIFRDIQTYAYSGIIQAYPGPCINLAYSELCYIQNPDILRTRGISKTLVYSESGHIQKPVIF